MSDIATVAEPTWEWAFPDQKLVRTTETEAEKQTPYEYFKITQGEANNIVQSFLGAGGVDRWKKVARSYRHGAEKEVCFVGGEQENGKDYAIKRGKHELNRETYPSHEMAKEQKQLEKGRNEFVPSQIVKGDGGPYIVTRYVNGTIPTDEEIIKFQTITGWKQTDRGNITKHPVVGLVLLDLGDS
jgi:hypothetical protein